MPLNIINVYVIKPKEAYNLVLNPSVEKATTGYTTVTSAIARVNTYQRRGAYSLEVTPTTGAESGVYYGTIALAAGTSYSFSADVKGVLGQAMRIQIRSTGGAVLAEQAFTANGYWQRVKIAYTEVSSVARRFYVVRDAVASVAKFYLDGFQVEEGNESTYLDGDMKGYSRERVDFRWTGIAHASTSWRSGSSKKGGELVNLRTFCTVLALIGLGMANVTPQATAMTMPGSVYQRTSVDDRDFSIPVHFAGSNLAEIAQKRKEVIQLLRPDTSSDDQPTTLVFSVTDQAGSEVFERSMIVAHYAGGLEMRAQNQFGEKATLSFRSFLPFVMADGSRTVNLSLSSSFTAHSIVRRNTTGVWDGFAIGATGPTVRVIERGPDGALYVGGYAVGGGATQAIGVWNGTALSALGTIYSTVYDMKFGPDGILYIGGGITTPHNYLTSWTGSAFAAVGTVASGGYSNIYVRSIIFTDNGDMWISGRFATVDGITCNGIAKRSAAGVWSAVGTGINMAGGEVIYSLATDGVNVWAAGNFSAINGVTAGGLAKWDGTVWTAVGSGPSGGSTANLIWYIVYDPQTARLYIAGNFQAFNGVAAEGIGYWNGSQFIALADNLGTNTTYSVQKRMFLDNDGILYLALHGGGGYLDGIKFPDAYMRLVGGKWMPIPVSILGGSTIYDIWVDDETEEMFIGFDSSVTATASTIAVQSLSTVRSSPSFQITGPGSLWEIRNYTTRQVITFDELTLTAGEILTLDLTPGQISFKSNFRGNMLDYIVPGSNLDFFLQSGTNNIAAYMTDTTAASEILMSWQDTYWSLDGAVR